MQHDNTQHPTAGRPPRSLTVTVPVEQRTWLIREAAARATETGQRISVSEVLRGLIDQARRDGGRAA